MTPFGIDLVSEANFYGASAVSAQVNRNDHYREIERIQVSAKLIHHSSIPVASMFMYAPTLS